MAIQVYNFNEFDGIAKVAGYPGHEFRIYLKGNSNTLATICNRFPDEHVYEN